MYVEKVKELRALEDEMEALKAAERAQAQQVLAQAQTQGKALLEKARADARDYEKQRLSMAEGAAQEKRSEVMLSVEKECEAIRQQAGTHMAEAAAAIVRRVVES